MGFGKGRPILIIAQVQLSGNSLGETNRYSAAFVHLPTGLSVSYLEHVLCGSLGKRVGIVNCAATNLCAAAWGGVSNSGSTLLHLSIELDDGSNMELVAKILSPDALNLFKLDRHFAARKAEIEWASWWGKQHVPWVPKIYATRYDTVTREFWIIGEHFPRIGWTGKVPGSEKAVDVDSARMLLTHAADLHAYSSKHIDELRALFPYDWPGLPAIIARVEEETADEAFLRDMGISEDEKSQIERFLTVAKGRPDWVDEWEVVCITSDMAPDNVGIRESNGSKEVVTFDWGTTQLAPMEAEVAIVLFRLQGCGREACDELVHHYLKEYRARTKRTIPQEHFMARLSWVRFIVHLWRIAQSLAQLRWVPHVTGPRNGIHLCLNSEFRCQNFVAGISIPVDF